MTIETPTKCSAMVAVLPTIADHNGSDRLSSLGTYGMPRGGYPDATLTADRSEYKIAAYALAIRI